MDTRECNVGFGTWKIKEEDMESAIHAAINYGYYHIDTAAAYGNEASVGRAICNSDANRADIYLSGKLWTTERAYNKVLNAFQKTLSNLKTDYLDAYLVHWPAASHLYENWERINSETWRAFEKLYNDGYVKNIGVCNCKPHHIESFSKYANVKPMINQIEFHPGWTQTEIVDYCKKEKISIEGWSPLGNGKMLKRKALQSMAEKYNKSVAQLCLRYSLQKGIIPLPKSINPQRIKENIDIFNFEIQKTDMDVLDSMPYMGGSGLDADTVTIFG